jgi:hypothetical protein
MAKTKGKKVAEKKVPVDKTVKGEKKATPGKAAAKAAKPAEGAKLEPKVSREELATLRSKIEEANDKLEKAQAEAKALVDKAHGLVAEAKDAFRVALAPYREACRKNGLECEYEGGRRSANVSEKVSFLVEKTEKGVRVMVKGQPKTEEMIPLAVVKGSINKAAYAYTEKHLGPKEEIGNKGGSLSNRLRAVMA